MEVEVVAPDAHDELASEIKHSSEFTFIPIDDGTPAKWNESIHRSGADIIVLITADITLRAATIEHLIERYHSKRLIGIADNRFSVVDGRLLVFDRELWNEINQFDEQLHPQLSTLDFTLKAKESGYRLEKIPRHALGIAALSSRFRGYSLRGILYLFGKHPKLVIQLFSGV
ncbi:MAG: glycosyltransferase family 2 protein [Halobacteriaceae archaeon]